MKIATTICVVYTIILSSMFIVTLKKINSFPIAQVNRIPGHADNCYGISMQAYNIQIHEKLKPKVTMLEVGFAIQHMDLGPMQFSRTDGRPVFCKHWAEVKYGDDEMTYKEFLSRIEVQYNYKPLK